MTTWPGEDQRELAATVRTLFERSAGSEAVRATVQSDLGHDEKLWSVMSDQLGLPGLAIAEEHGGSGTGLGELAAVAYEMGRAVVPSPWFSTVLAAEVIAADPAAARDLLPALASGAAVGAVAMPVDGRPVGLPKATADDEGNWTLEGSLGQVVDGLVASVLVVPALTSGTLEVFVVDPDTTGADRARLSTLDLTRCQARIRLSGVPARRLDIRNPHEVVDRVGRWALTLLAAEQVGGAERCLEISTEYAATRTQFGRAIGSFQSIKHMCADMLVALELARSLLGHAVTEVAAGGADAAVSARAAKIGCGQAYTKISADTIQVLGGIGFTWEHDAHLYFRRAHADTHLFGGPGRHRDGLAELVLAGEVGAADGSEDAEDELAAFAARARDWLVSNAVPFDRLGVEDGGRARVAAAKAFQRKRFDVGLAGISWPTEYGGQGLSAEFEAAFAHAAEGFETFEEVFVIGLEMCGPVLLALGTDEQKRRYLPDMLTAETFWCQLFSEPGAGSDLAGLRTKAVRTESGWKINGQKVWNTYAHLFDYGLLLARTDPDVPKHKGITMFIVDMKTPGITCRPLRQITGDDEFNEVFLDDVELPADAVVGEIGQGWQAALMMLANERRALGRNPLALSPPVDVARVIDLVRRRDLGTDPVVRQQVADLWVRERSLRLLGARIATRTRAGEDPGPFASIGKVGAGLLAKDVVALGVELAGPEALAWESDEDGIWSYGLLYAPMMTIAGGTDQIQRTIIGERLLGLPKEP